MKVTTKTALVPVLLAALLGGCGHDNNSSNNSGGTSSRDKAGGSNAPVTLQLGMADDADQPDAPFARYFASRVKKLSHGAVRVRPVWDAAGQGAPDYEARLARMVRKGRYDLGWIGSRSWDQVGVTSFQALQAPFLVTDQALLGRIATGAVAERMLSGLDDGGFVGLALVPGRMRYPFGVKHPLASLEDFAGARVRVFPSSIADALIRALGATPVHVSGDDVGKAVAKGQLDGTEAQLGTNSSDEGENQLTANLALFAKTLTLFAGRDAFERLDEDQRAIVETAARQTAAYAAAHPASESALIREFCDGGRTVAAVTATPDDVAALTQAAQPVYADLEREPTTKALIAAIRELKTSTPTGTSAAPPTCTKRHAADAGGRTRSPSTVNGTYRWRVTSEGARAAGGSPDSEDVGTIGKMTLREGKWRMGDEAPEEYSGTYAITDDRLVFDWGDDKLVFDYERDADGGLVLEPVQPMNLGDAVVWAGGPWRRVGPPVLDIP